MRPVPAPYFVMDMSLGKQFKSIQQGNKRLAELYGLLEDQIAATHPSWFKMASTLLDDTAPCARPVPPGARAAPTYPRAQPEHLRGLRWPLWARLSLLRR